MKRLISLIMAAIILISALPSAFAAPASEVQQVIKSLGIITGDKTGNMTLAKSVTRAEFAKMLVCASTSKDSVSSMSNSSPFSDVPYTNWASGYIKTAVKNGWLSGYLNGTYKPNNTIKLEEAVTAVLKLLGYTSSDFSGTFPYGQLAMYQSLKLNKNISAQKGSELTRQDCMYLFYNALNTKSKGSDKYYIETLGYTASSDGEVDYVQLISDTMDGPIISQGSLSDNALPVNTENAQLYRNGISTTADAITKYDVLYYSSKMNTIWAYSNKVTGTFEKALPNLDYPTSVVVSGVTYELSGTAATLALSSAGTLNIGDNVTLLLGKDGKAVGAIPAAELSSVYYGIVTGEGTGTYQNSAGVTHNAKYIKLFATDGTSYNIQTNKSYDVGALLQVSFTNGETAFSYLIQNRTGGTVDAAARTLGSFKLARDVSIIDVYDTSGVSIYLSRLDGMSLNSSDVKFYSLNKNGEIDKLILNNATGDCYEYGVITSASESNSNMNLSGKYTYDVGGVSKNYSISGVLNLRASAAIFIKEDGTLSQIKALSQTGYVTYAQDLTLKAETKSYKIWDKASVYIYSDYKYTLSSLSQVNDLSKYTLEAYYDKDEEDGGRIRVIIATPKTVL